MRAEQKHEWLMCSESPLYFVDRYCQLYDATAREWQAFSLWNPQVLVLRAMRDEKLVIVLKARQLGLTWLALAFALWLCLFRPAATVMVFSKRDDEAVYLLGDERLKGMYARLPDFLKARSFTANSAHMIAFSNGSVVRAFPNSAGDSYTASLVIVDEADLVPDLNRLMRSVKPTIDGGGRMMLLSRPDKSKPQSEFKKIYRAAKLQQNGWRWLFLPWDARPSRDAAWYAEQRADILSRTGSLDDLYEQYPATDIEALEPRTLDKRIAPQWLRQCYTEVASSQYSVASGAPAIPQMVVYAPLIGGREYVIGVDTAEGNPTSDDSALTVLEKRSGEEVAALRGKFEPSTLAAHTDEIGRWYNNAAVLVERNNHGHAFILWMKDHSPLTLLCGEDGREGWQTNTNSKALLYSRVADTFREKGAVIHSFITLTQLQSIEGSTLRAPEGEMDDCAVSFVLADMARSLRVTQGGFSV